MKDQTALHYVLEGSFCSFRDPVAAKYQPTFWFPPKTTVVGFLGCALGLEPPNLEPLYESLRVGVVLQSWGGMARDLWGFTKLKKAGDPETAVLLRELIYRPRYAFYIATEEMTVLEQLRDALLDPVYPLRFGRGEDLAILRGKPRLLPLSPVQEVPWLRWTLLPYAIHDRACMLEGFDSEPRPRRPPRTSRMPVRFRHDQDWVREAEATWATEVFDWGVCPPSPDDLWTDGEYVFYLI